MTHRRSMAHFSIESLQFSGTLLESASWCAVRQVPTRRDVNQTCACASPRKDT